MKSKWPCSVFIELVNGNISDISYYLGPERLYFVLKCKDDLGLTASPSSYFERKKYCYITILKHHSNSFFIQLPIGLWLGCCSAIACTEWTSLALPCLVVYLEVSQTWVRVFIILDMLWLGVFGPNSSVNSLRETAHWGATLRATYLQQLFFCLHSHHQ